ncbi:MAG: HD-GYP domain-containing protein [Candidatus Xenobia bacterium]
MNPFVYARSAADLADRLDSLVQRRIHAEGVRLWLVNDEEALQEVRSGEVQTEGCASQAALQRETARVSGTVIAVPVISLGQVIGVVEAWHGGEAPWGKPEEKALQGIADDVAAGVVAVQTREDLEAFSVHAAEWIMAGVEARAPGGSGHHFRVCHIADFLASRLWFSPQDRQRIFRAAQYHDIGWVAASGHQDWEVEQYHPLYGAQALRSVRLLGDLAPLVELHHERYDGSGRPMGLKGDAVPLEAYILALAEDLDEAAVAHAFGQPEAAGLEGEASRFSDFLTAFMHERKGSHHPRVLKTLDSEGALSELWGLFR